MPNLENMIDNLEKEFDVTWNILRPPQEVKKVITKQNITNLTRYF